MALLEDIRTRLVAAGVGVAGTTLFIGRGLPDTPDACVALQQYAGDAPIDTLGQAVGTAAIQRPRVQVTARALTVSAAETKAKACFAALHNYQGTLNGTRYLRIQALQDVFLMRLDKNNRVVYGANFEVWKDFS